MIKLPTEVNIGASVIRKKEKTNCVPEKIMYHTVFFYFFVVLNYFSFLCFVLFLHLLYNNYNTNLLVTMNIVLIFQEIQGNGIRRIQFRPFKDGSLTMGQQASYKTRECSLSLINVFLRDEKV